jgi:hypothetical protein
VRGPDPSDQAGDSPPGGPTGRAGLLERLLASVSDRAEIARRLESPALERLLRSIVDATVELFDAEASSIALVDGDGRLRFRVAAGPQGAGVVGLTVAVGEGIAGYVQQTGQPLALSDVTADPRFEQETAARTGYVPRSVLAVPLELDDQVIGVLEVLDKRAGAGFDLTDLARAGVFARQAAVAIDVARLERSLGDLLADSLRALAEEDGRAEQDRPGDPVADDVDRLVSDVSLHLDSADPAFWRFVDRLAALRSASPEQLPLIADMLDVVLAHLPGRSVTRAAGGGSWRDRIAAEDAEQ